MSNIKPLPNDEARGKFLVIQGGASSRAMSFDANYRTWIYVLAALAATACGGSVIEEGNDAGGNFRDVATGTLDGALDSAIDGGGLTDARIPDGSIPPSDARIPDGSIPPSDARIPDASPPWGDTGISDASSLPKPGTVACDGQETESGTTGICVLCSDLKWYCGGAPYEQCPATIDSGASCNKVWGTGAYCVTASLRASRTSTISGSATTRGAGPTFRGMQGAHAKNHE
jgi:hypothetical protein